MNVVNELEFIKNDYKSVMLAVQQNGLLLQFASKEMQNNNDIIYAAVKQNVASLQYADEEFKNDFIKMYLLINDNVKAVIYIGEKLKNNKNFALSLVSQHGDLIQYFNKQILSDKEVISVALSNNSYAIQYLPEDIRNTKDVIGWAFALEQRYLDNGIINPTLLKYLNKNMCDNKAIVSEAIALNYEALEYASERLKNDKEFIKKFAINNIQVLKYAGNNITDDRESMLLYCSLDNYTIAFNVKDKKIGTAISYASDRLKNDKEFIVEIIEHALANKRDQYNFIFNILLYVGNNIINDKELMTSFVQIDPLNFKYASEELRNDFEFIYTTLTSYRKSNVDTPSHLFKNILQNIVLHVGPQFKEQLGDNNFEYYCDALAFNNRLDDVLPLKNISSKKLKI